VQVSKRFPFIRLASFNGDISRFFSDQNFDNQLPLNVSDTFTYLDTLLLNFHPEETNMLDHIPPLLTNLDEQQISFILDQLRNESLSQRQLLRHFDVNYFTFKKFLKKKGFRLDKLVRGRLPIDIPDELEALVINYLDKFKKGYQSIYKTLKLKGLAVSEKQIRKIFKEHQLWRFNKVKKNKKLHNKRYVALFSNMEWHIDLHYWDTVDQDNNHIYQYLFAVIDDLARYLLFAKVLETKTMESTGMELNECIESTHCKPYIIATDNGTEFTGSFFEEVLLKYNIKHYLTHPYTPEENAKLERWWGTLEGAIINPEDLQLLIKEYNFNWVHKELARMIGTKMTPSDAWKRLKRYEGVPEEELIIILW
jgi:transposase InsO family protein